MLLLFRVHLKQISPSFPLHQLRRRISTITPTGFPLNLPKLEPSSDAKLISQMLIINHNPFHFMESSLQLNGISHTPNLIHQTLLRLHHNSKIALSFFQYLRSLPSPSTPTPTSFNLIIDILGRVRQFDVVRQLIVEMDQTSPETFLILVKRLIAAGLTRQAVRAFDDALCFLENRRFGLVEFGFLLDTLCKYGYTKMAVGVFNERKEEFGCDEKVYTILITDMCKLQRIDMVEKFLVEMIESGIEPNVITYNVLLNGICQTASLHPEESFERNVRIAEKVFDKMRQRGIEPDVMSFSIVLHMNSRALKAELTLDYLKLMKAKGISPTTPLSCLSFSSLSPSPFDQRSKLGLLPPLSSLLIPKEHLLLAPRVHLGISVVVKHGKPCETCLTLAEV